MQTPEQYVKAVQSSQKTPEPRHWNCFGVFIANFKQNLHIVLVFPLMTLNM